jgi:trk system potassium uptake protein TrkH
VLISLFGALPFIISGAIPNFIDALFETVSGFTTTGASILSEVESLPKSILMWRSFTHWVGGMGVLVFVMAFLPLAGGQNMHIMKAESPGPEVSKFVPKVRDTALILYGIYFGLTVLAFISYWISGMDFFEAINTAFSTAGTGGFSIRDDSCASLSPVQQWLIIIFMFLFGVNFNTYYLLLRKKIKDAFNAEVRVYTTFVILAISIISVNIYLQLSEFSNFGDAIRHAAFYVTALISTTGFATVDYNLWPTISHVVLMLALFMGACAGSTGGGFKVSRVMILLKGMKNEVQKAIHPRQIKRITMDKKPVDGEVVRNVNAFLCEYVNIVVREIDTVRGNRLAIKNSERIKIFNRCHTVFIDAIVEFVFSFGNVNVYPHSFFFC